MHEQRAGTPRAQTVAEIERELLELYCDPTLTEKPALLDQRGGAYYSEAATQLVASLRPTPATCRSSTSATATRSRALADDDVVEVPARIGRDGPAPLPQRRWPPSCSGSSSTSRPTSGWPPRRRSRAIGTPPGSR